MDKQNNKKLLKHDNSDDECVVDVNFDIFKKSDSKIDKKKGRHSKDDNFKLQQDKLFVEIKELINYNKETNKFSASDVYNNKDKLFGDIFDRIKLYFHCSLWIRINTNVDGSSVIIVRNIFKHFGYSLVSQTMRKKKDGKSEVFRTFIVIKNDDNVV